MLLEDRIYQDYVAALKARDKTKTDFLSMVRAELRNAGIDLKKKPLPDTDALVVLKKQKKKLEESKESILTSGRKDLLEKVNVEISIMDGYLPQQLDVDQISKVVYEVITSLQASSIKDMGKVMKEVLGKIGAQADAKIVSDLVKSKLS